MLASCAGHGVMQQPLPWQLGNVQPGLEKFGGSSLGHTACVNNGCMWFSNYTNITKPTMPRESPLRTFTGLEAWLFFEHSPWRAPGAAKVWSPCGFEGGNPRGCFLKNGSSTPCTQGAGFGFGIDGRTIGALGATTEWVQGSVVETAWSLFANHGALGHFHPPISYFCNSHHRRRLFISSGQKAIFGRLQRAD